MLYLCMCNLGRNKMKFILLFIVSLILPDTHVGAQCEMSRFREKVFDGITIHNNVQYGTNTNNLGEQQNLYMDIYMPPADADTMIERPVILFMHGGAYVAGDKTGSTMRLMCNEFSRRGYVAVAVQYRLEKSSIEFEPIFEFANKINWYRAIVRSVHDIKGALRFLKYTAAEEGNPYGIDTNNFTLYGSSAGAIGVLHTMFLDETDELTGSWTQAVTSLGGFEGNTSGHFQYGSTNTVKNLIIDSGALFEVDWIGDVTDYNIMALHNKYDPSVPYSHDCFYVAACHLGKFYGAGRYVSVLRRNGANVVFHSLDGMEHPVDDLQPAFALEQAVNFLYDAQCKYYTNPDTTVPTGIAGRNISEIKLYPNPSTGSFTIRANEAASRSLLQIFALSGQMIHEEQLQRKEQIIHLNAPAGVYFVTITDETGNKSIAKLTMSR